MSFYVGLEKRAKSKWETMLRTFQHQGKHDEVRRLLGGITKTPYGPLISSNADAGVTHMLNVRSLVAQNTAKNLTADQVAAAARRASKESLRIHDIDAVDPYSKHLVRMDHKRQIRKLKDKPPLHDVFPVKGEEYIEVSHGGERSFIDRFLKGDARGYGLESSARKGIQVTPHHPSVETPSRDNFYALRAQGSFGGVPAVLKGKVQAKYLQAANNSYEAGLTAENAKHLKDVSVQDVSGDSVTMWHKTPMEETVAPFKKGFTKRAYDSGSPIIGVHKGLRSGLSSYESGGEIQSPEGPKPGVSIAPRFKPLPLPSYERHHPKSSLKPSLPPKRGVA